MGRRSNKTPFYYPVYKNLLTRFFNFCNKPEHADVLVFGTSADFLVCASTILRCKSLNPKLHIVVVSEEPYWDTLWGGDFSERYQQIELEGETIKYTYLNHSTSLLFAFNKIPYFITTENYFFTRYALLFSRNASLDVSDIQKRWACYQYAYAAMAQYRKSEAHNEAWDKVGVYGLSDIRTQLTEAMLSNKSFVMGKGWPDSQVRQSLADWHLDKLTCLDQQSRFVSALENTHQINYISEKIFDAYALLAIPVYFANELHRVNELVPSSSFINLFEEDLESSILKIKTFQLQRDFLKQYQQAQVVLKELFSDVRHLDDERERMCSVLIHEFGSLSC